MENRPELDQQIYLLNILHEHFNGEELRTLCFHLGVEYEDLSGGGRAGKARELIRYLARHKQVEKLVTVGKVLRPDIDWEEPEERPESPDLEQMRVDYLASLRQRFEYLDLGGIAPRVQNRTVKLRMEDVFIRIKVKLAP